MARKEGAWGFTELEKQAIKAQIADYMIFNMTDIEIYKALEKRFKRTISQGYIKKTKSIIRAEQGSADQWLEIHVRTDLADFYRQRIDELQYIQKNLFQILDEEKNKGDKMNVYKYNQIAKTAIENSKVLAEFGMAPPVISKIKQLLPIDINELNKRVEHQKALSEHLDKEDIKQENVIEVDTLSENEQSELENIRKRARETKTGIFLDYNGKNDGKLPGDDKQQPSDSQRVF